MKALVKKLKSEIFELTSIDALTKLPNRARFEKFAAGLISQNKSLALFMIDLDEFKPVNDKYGHQAGDQVLQKIARIHP